MEAKTFDQNNQNVTNDNSQVSSENIRASTSKTKPADKEFMMKNFKKNIIQRSVSENGRRSFNKRSPNQTDLPVTNKTESISFRRSQSARYTKNNQLNFVENKPEKINVVSDIENTIIEALKFRYQKKMEISFEINSDEYDSDTDGSFFNLSFGELINDQIPNTGFYEKTLSVMSNCEICMEPNLVNQRQCCGLKSCNQCINLYIQNKIKESCGNLTIECLNNNCKKLINRDEICDRMLKFDKNTHDLYLKLLIEANKDSNVKTCPQCSHAVNAELVQRVSNREKKKSNNKTKLLTKCRCKECNLMWCFQCHAPWHEGITCSKFRKSDRMLKYWSKEVHCGQKNAQMCPKCKIYIQRIKGCDHITCTNCKSEFCYSCGEKYRSIKFIGDHHSKLSIFGCKYKLYPNNPFKRKAIRGSIFGLKLAVSPLIIAGGLVIGAGLLVVGTLALPIYVSYRVYKNKKKLQKTIKRTR